MNNNELPRQIIGAAIEVHRLLGPGLLESAYQACLCHELAVRGLRFEKQKPCGVRLDLLVQGRVLVELKSIEGLAPAHQSIMLTYLRLSEDELDMLINFNLAVLKDGVHRFIMPRANKKVFIRAEDAEAMEKKVSAKHAN
jgi:GxxExxY protein